MTGMCCLVTMGAQTLLLAPQGSRRGWPPPPRLNPTSLARPHPSSLLIHNQAGPRAIGWKPNRSMPRYLKERRVLWWVLFVFCLFVMTFLLLFFNKSILEGLVLPEVSKPQWVSGRDPVSSLDTCTLTCQSGGRHIIKCNNY